MPWMLVVGGREMESNEVALRIRHQGDQGTKQLDVVIKDLLDAAASKS